MALADWIVPAGDSCEKPVFRPNAACSSHSEWSVSTPNKTAPPSMAVVAVSCRNDPLDRSDQTPA